MALAVVVAVVAMCDSPLVVCVGVCVYVYACVHMCVNECARSCVCDNVCVRIHTHANTPTFMSDYTRVYVSSSMCVCAHTCT